jgi:hypothetical protein
MNCPDGCIEVETCCAQRGGQDRLNTTKNFILRIAAMRKGFPAEAYAATAYNPFGDGAPYTWNYARQFLEVGEDMLIGRDFWAKIGDEHTYGELLEIAEAVGAEITELIAEPGV